MAKYGPRPATPASGWIDFRLNRTHRSYWLGRFSGCRLRRRKSRNWRTLVFERNPLAIQFPSSEGSTSLYFVAKVVRSHAVGPAPR